MNVNSLFLIATVLLLIAILTYLIFYLPQSKSQEIHSLEEKMQLRLGALFNHQKESGQQQEKLLQLRWEQLEKELKANKEGLTQQQKEQENLLKTHLESLSKQQKTSSESQEKLLQLRLDSFGQELKSSKEALSQINNLLLAPFKRGRLGNIQLDRLLSLYLPKDDRIYRLEYTLKKKTAKGEGLRPDAVIFGIEQKNNLAIDSKFPFENYLSAGQEGLSPAEEEERTKKFKENLKTHIKKIAEYISPLDHTKHVIMFIPSEVVFAKINEQSYYDIIEFALAKKVSLCSPVTLAIIVNQVLWTNQIHEQYQTMDQVLAKLQTFWTDFNRWQDRWAKILEVVNKSNKALQEFNTSVEKIVKHGEKIREVKTVPNLVQPVEPLASLPEK